MRGPGALMAIDERGNTAGYVSNGCVDGDIASRAIAAMKTGENAALRYGEGSPFKDIVLPCGGSIDVLIITYPDIQAVQTLSASLRERESLRVYASVQVGLSLSAVGGFSHDFKPKLRLQVAGRGAAMTALAMQAAAAGIDVFAASPEQDDLDELSEIRSTLLTPNRPAFARADAHTAVTVMFHDHDWEPPILLAALDSPAFFIGALGSRNTHAARLHRLRAMGADEAQLNRIHGPVGLIPSLRDANLVAVSTLAHIIQCAKEAGRL